MSDLPEVSSLTEAAAFLRIEKPDTLRRMAARGEIGYLKQGRTYVFPASVLTEYVESRTVKADVDQWGLTTQSRQRLRRKS